MTTDGVLLVDKPAGVTSHDVVAQVRRRLRQGRQGRPRRARWTRSRPGCCSCCVGRGDARPALPDGAAQALRDRRAAGLHVDHGRPRGRDRARDACRGELLAADGRASRQRPPAYSAIKIGGKRAYALARAGEDGRGARARGRGHALRAAVARGRAARRSRSSAPRGTYVRSLIADLRRRVLRRAAAHADRRLRRRRRRRGAARRRSTTRSSSCPAVELDRRGRAQGRPRRGRPRPRRRASSACATRTA